jgi:Zn-dependent protease with chaperone function
MRKAGKSAYFLVFLLLARCASAPMSRTVNNWVSQQGGVVEGSWQARADEVSRRLTACCSGRTIRVQVLATNAVSAFSWRNGRVFITRGLMNHLDDQELAAVIAHELGHLLSDGQLQTVASLRGYSDDPDREVRADAAGVGLLKMAGLPPQPMISMLKKVEKYGSLPVTCQSAMDRRIAILSHSLEQRPPLQ